MDKKNILLICPANDAEAVEAANLARQNGVTVLVTRQPWGASWEPVFDGERLDSTGLEYELQEQIEQWRADNPAGQIYGLELRGANPWGALNIDHHFYRLPGDVVDDRRSPKSSLEQLAELLGVKLTPYQRLVAENDKAYIPGMEKELGRLGIEPGSPKGKGLINLVRQTDRTAQGVTPDDEAAAAADVDKAQWRGRKVLIKITTASGTAQGDLLHGKADEQLQVNGVSGKWIYFGPRAGQFAALGLPEQHWGGTGGYFGIQSPGEDSQRRMLEFFWGD